MTDINMDNVDLLLSKLDKTQLENFIRRECSIDEQVRARFLALGAGTFFKPNPETYASRVDNLIDDYSGRYGYIEYRDTFDFNRAVSLIIDEAEDAIADESWDVALAVLTGISSVAEDILNCGDDSAGELGAIISNCFEKWHELCIADSVPESIKNEIFEYALSMFNDKYLEGWDWWWDWMEMAVTLADSPERRGRVNEALDVIISCDDDDWSTEYHAEMAKRYKLELMSHSGSVEDQIKFMYDNVSDRHFRERLLQIAWDKSDYDEVLRLAKEGEEQDAKYDGLVNGWSKWEYKVYCETGDKDNQLRLARYFFFKGGRFGEKEYYMEPMYAAIKSLVPQNEWTNYVKTLIIEAQKKDTNRLLHIYTQEKMWEEYMAYLRENPSTCVIEDAPKEVKQLFKDEIIMLYAVSVRSFFSQASNRDAYREGVGLLRRLIDLGGKKEAEQIAAEQKSRTPRRPALIDELSKL